MLSPRTVSDHLHKIFPKLGITTRAALRDALEELPRLLPRDKDHRRDLRDANDNVAVPRCGPAS